MDALGTLFRYAGFMAGARAALGLQVSRVGFYAKPPGAMFLQARLAAGVRGIEQAEFSGEQERGHRVS